jgi:hypothetical protein
MAILLALLGIGGLVGGVVVAVLGGSAVHLIAGLIGVLIGAVLLGSAAIVEAVYRAARLRQRDAEADVVCPFCAEDVRAEAVICPHCHRDLKTPTVTDRLNPLRRRR